MAEKGIQLTRQEKRVAASKGGIEIQFRGKPIDSSTLGAGTVYLVVDCSASMSGDKLNYAKKGALNFAKDALPKGYSVGLIGFDSSANVICAPHKSIDLLEKAIYQLYIGGGTNMEFAIRLAHTELNKANTAPRVIVIVTDGVPDNVEAALMAGKKAKQDKIDIIAIGTDDADQAFLQKLASRTDLGTKVHKEQFQQAITDSVKLLPPTGI